MSELRWLLFLAAVVLFLLAGLLQANVLTGTLQAHWGALLCFGLLCLTLALAPYEKLRKRS